MAFSYSHLYKLNTTGLRFFTVYGPWGRPDMAMYIFAKNILEKREIVLFNNGKMRRDFTFIDDIIYGIRRSIDKNYRCEIFNLGNNKSEDLLNMVSIIEKTLDLKANIKLDGMQPGDVKNTYADIQRSKEKLGYVPTISIDKGIPIFLKWLKGYLYK